MPCVFPPRAWGLIPRLLLVAAASLPAVACSLVTDTSGLTSESTPDGATTNGTTGVDGGTDGVVPAPPGTCPSAGYGCVTEPPAGWGGPVILYDGPEVAAPSCPNTMANAVLDGHKGLIAPSAHTCSQCTCQKGTATCAANLMTSSQPSCGGSFTQRSLSIGNCVVADGMSMALYAPATTTSCPADAAVPTRPEPSWSSKVRACGAPTLLRTGCEAGKVCAPDPPSPFQGRHCIVANGDVACPAGPYTVKTVAASSVSDNRDCAPCECHEGEPSFCSGTLQYFPSSSTCGSTPTTITGDSFSCTDGSGSVKLLTLSGEPNCVPVAGTGLPTGDVQPAELTTTCCLP